MESDEDLAAKLRRAVELEDWPISVVDATLDATGWDHIVLVSQDGWILQFPRSPDFDLEREVNVLNCVRGRLSAQTPVVQFVGSVSRVIAYRRIVGRQLDVRDVSRMSERELERLAESLAGILVEMHTSLSDDCKSQLELPHFEFEQWLDVIRREYSHSDASSRAELDHMMRAFSKTTMEPSPKDVVLHNDFHLGNIAFMQSDVQILGLWDFSSVSVGPAWLDFRYLARVGGELLERTSRYYTRMAGAEIDTESARNSLQLETLYDEIILGRRGPLR